VQERPPQPAAVGALGQGVPPRPCFLSARSSRTEDRDKSKNLVCEFSGIFAPKSPVSYPCTLRGSTYATCMNDFKWSHRLEALCIVVQVLAGLVALGGLITLVVIRHGVEHRCDVSRGTGTQTGTPASCGRRV